MRNVFKLVTQVGQAAAAARCLEASGAQEQRMQTGDRFVASRAVGPKSAEPLARSVVDRGRDCRGECRHRPLEAAPASSRRDRLCSPPDKLLLRESGGDQQQRRADHGECGRVGLESFHLCTSL